MLYPNVTIDSEQAMDIAKQAAKSNTLVNLPVTALRAIGQNEEILMCYGSTYRAVRKQKNYSASSGKLANHDFAGAVFY